MGSPKNPYPKLSTRWRYVSVSQAKQWIEQTTHNRRVRQAWVVRYARDILSGAWGISDSSIVIDDQKNVINGQHRLRALVLANKGVWMHVISGAPRESIIDFDLGGKRTVKDNLALSGTIDEQFDGRMIGVCKFLMQYGSAKGKKSIVPTHHEVQTFMLEHYEHLSRVCRLFTKSVRGVTISPIIACVCAAWMSGVSKTRLQQFVKVLITGESHGGKDSAAIKLRDFLRDPDRTNYGGTGRVEVYKKAQRALVAFVDERKLKRLYAVSRDQWPLSG